MMQGGITHRLLYLESAKQYSIIRSSYFCMVPLTPPAQSVVLANNARPALMVPHVFGLRAAKSLTSSMGRQDRQLTECQAGYALCD
ncbi:hypothetical protein LCER1_G004520 [Lachnellula cervina]|uniref:Uncharacterized protein n=1 Tax=Lachnellula cervina TaxID=1316786 RepID=A0A7D8YSS5_9HELO|nr:hypothetical protein LCER1_G004520 [Lachnellula cervina]